MYYLTGRLTISYRFLRYLYGGGIYDNDKELNLNVNQTKYTEKWEPQDGKT